MSEPYTDEEWANLKEGDLIVRGYDDCLCQVQQNNKGRKGKPNELILQPVAPPRSYPATEPKAYRPLSDKEREGVE